MSKAFPERANQPPGVVADDLMSEAGRKILAHYFAKMRRQEPAVLRGGDAEAVHDMRVATRRLRSAFSIFRPFYHAPSTKIYRRFLRETARALGNVRDLDVFVERALSHSQTLPAAEQKAFQPLIQSWQTQNHMARAPLLDLLQSNGYAAFVSTFTTFVITAGMGIKEESTPYPQPRRVCEVVPSLIYAQYGAARAYAPNIEDASLETLHQLRIEVKRLRYLMEAFAEVLGNGAKTAIQATKTLQDYLGELQDSRVTVEMLHDYLEHKIDHDAPITAEGEAIHRYMLVCGNTKTTLRAGVAEQWQHFTSAEVRQAIGRAVADM
jgi:triphosphatase